MNPIGAGTIGESQTSLNFGSMVIPVLVLSLYSPYILLLGLPTTSTHPHPSNIGVKRGKDNPLGYICMRWLMEMTVRQFITPYNLLVSII